MAGYTERAFKGTCVDLNYAEFGGDGPTLIMAHGFSGRWQGHLAYIERLPGWHIYAIDHAGHGLSGNRRGTCKLIDLTNTVVIAAMELNRLCSLRGR